MFIGSVPLILNPCVLCVVIIMFGILVNSSNACGPGRDFLYVWTTNWLPLGDFGPVPVVSHQCSISGCTEQLFHCDSYRRNNFVGICDLCPDPTPPSLPQGCVNYGGQYGSSSTGRIVCYNWCRFNTFVVEWTLATGYQCWISDQCNWFDCSSYVWSGDFGRDFGYICYASCPEIGGSLSDCILDAATEIAYDSDGVLIAGSTTGSESIDLEFGDCTLPTGSPAIIYKIQIPSNTFIAFTT